MSTRLEADPMTGLVLTSEHRPIYAFISSLCGGVIVLALSLVLYLQGVTNYYPDDFLEFFGSIGLGWGLLVIVFSILLFLNRVITFCGEP